MTITTRSDTKPYDGTPLTKKNDYSVEGIIDGETYGFKVTGSQTEVGNSLNNYIITLANEGNNYTAKQSNYTIKENLGILTVTQASLIITVNDKETTYNGSTQYGYSFENEGINGTGSDIVTEEYTITGLASGDVLTVTGYQPVSGKDAGTYPKDTFDGTVSITRNGVDVSSYYDVTTTAGKLKINKANLTITADSNSKEYDGTPLTDDGWQDTAPAGLKGTDAVESVTVTGTITEVGTEDNFASAAVVKNGEKDVTENYDITYVAGTLEITESETALVIGSSTKSWTYDGQTHTDEVYNGR